MEDFAVGGSPNDMGSSDPGASVTKGGDQRLVGPQVHESGDSTAHTGQLPDRPGGEETRIAGASDREAVVDVPGNDIRGHALQPVAEADPLCELPKDWTG